MTTTRYLATDNLLAELRRQERSIRWLWKKVGDAGMPMSDTMFWYIATGRNSASIDTVESIATILHISVDSIFTTVDKDVRERREAK